MILADIPVPHVKIHAYLAYLAMLDWLIRGDNRTTRTPHPSSGKVLGAIAGRGHAKLVLGLRSCGQGKCRCNSDKRSHKLTVWQRGTGGIPKHAGLEHELRHARILNMSPCRLLSGSGPLSHPGAQESVKPCARRLK